MAKDNFANLSPSKINVMLEYSHPPIHQRIEAVHEEMKKIADVYVGDGETLGKVIDSNRI